MTFGEWFRETRRMMKLSGRGLAKLAGYGPTYVSDIERGHRPPSAQFLRAAARFVPNATVLYLRAGVLPPCDALNAVTDVDLSLAWEAFYTTLLHSLGRKDGTLREDLQTPRV